MTAELIPHPKLARQIRQVQGSATWFGNMADDYARAGDSHVAGLMRQHADQAEATAAGMQHDIGLLIPPPPG